MNALTLFLLLIPGAYLVGAVPWGFLIGKWSRGVDVRSTGSGSTGSSNVLRSIGAKQAALVLLLDIAKGTAAVMTARVLADVADLTSLQTSYLEMASGLAALVGHNWPIYLKFKGGRGVATGLGAMLGLFPIGGVIVFIISISLMRITRYISLGSIIGVPLGGLSLVLFGFLGEFSAVYGIYGGAATIIIVGRHRANIVRLLTGTEARLGQSVKTKTEA